MTFPRFPGDKPPDPAAYPAPIYDLAYHHKNPKSQHRHSIRCLPLPWRNSAHQFLRCMRVELGRIRKEV